MQWYTLLNEMLELRSFSNLWFWIVLAVAWSSASHWVMGVPFDLIVRAGRDEDTQTTQDFRDLVRINVNRVLHIADVSGLTLVALGSFFLTSLAVIGWGFDMQIGQAIFLFGFPMSLIWILNVRAARGIRSDAPDDAALIKRLKRLRTWTQVIGMVSIFVTSIWGIYSVFAYQIDENPRPFGALIAPETAV